METEFYLISLSTILRKEIQRFFRIWAQTLLPSAITVALYFIIFGNLIGPRIGNIEGVKYIQYIAPGLIMMSVITNSYTNVSSSFYLARFTRSIEELLVSPTPNHLILLGFIGGGILRGITVGIVVTIITLLFTHLSIHHLGVIIIIIILTSALFSIAGLINGIYAKSFDDIMIVPTFVLTPLTYLGGIFYSINLLPPLWRHISMANPILYMVNVFRYGTLGISDVHVWLAITMVAVLVVALYVLALILLNKGVGIRT